MNDLEKSTEKVVRADVQRYLNFSLGTEEFAIPLLSVKEVVALPETTRVPHSPPHFLGIMNLRGHVISIFDLRIKFRIKPENTSETAVIICDLAPLSFGVVVNSVNSVLSVHEGDIKGKPELHTKQNSEYMTGVVKSGEKLVLLLDIAKSLNVEDKVIMQKSATGKVA